MAHKPIPLTLAFAMSALAALFRSAVLPDYPLHAFAPFLALSYSRSSFPKALWAAALCGLALDLLSSEARFGLWMLNFLATTFILYRQRSHFFEEKPLALSLYTALISLCSTALQLLLCASLDKKIPITLPLLATDLLLFPCLDGLYAFLWFICPLRLYQWLKQQMIPKSVD